MKLIDISSNCYAHLVNNAVYLYVNNEFSEIFYIDNIENVENPVSLIMHEVELSARPSLFKCIELV